MAWDINSANVTLLLHGGGAAIVDSSVSSLAVAVVGTPVLSATTAVFATTSIRLDGSGHLGFNSSNLAFGTADFTVESWVNLAAVPTGTIRGLFQLSTAGGLSALTTNLAVTIDLGGGFNLLTGDGTVTASSLGSGTGAWFHLAVARTSGVTRLFINGAVGASVADTFSYSGSDGIVGGYIDTAHRFNGYLEEFRITKNLSRYSAAFVPPLFAFGSNGFDVGDPYFESVVLAMNGDGSNGSTVVGDRSSFSFPLTQGANPVVVSTAQSQFGGSSIYIDGSVSSYTGRDVAALPTLSFGTNDFTIEFWARKSSSDSTADAYLMQAASTATPGGGWTLYLCQSLFAFYHSGASYFTCTLPSSCHDDTWHHYAFSRNSGTLRGYQDGALLNTATYTASLTATEHFLLGKSTSGYPFTGYVDDLRITNGVGRYSAAFSAPTTTIAVVPPGVATVAVSAPLPVVNARGGGRATLTGPSATLGAYGGGTSLLALLAPVVAITTGTSVALTAPLALLDSTGRDSAGDQSFSGSLPMPTVAGFGGANLSYTLTEPTVVTSATAAILGVAALDAPAPLVASTGTVRGTGTAAVTFGVTLGSSYGLKSYGGGSGLVTLPSATATATATQTNKLSAALSMPLAAVSSYGGGTASLTPLKPTLAAAGRDSGGGASITSPVAAVFITAGANAPVTAPVPLVSSTGYASGGVARISAPSASLVGYSGAVVSVTLAGLPAVAATGKSGGSAAAAVTLRLFDLVASGTAQNFGGAALLSPMPVMGNAAVAWLVSAPAQLTAIGSATVSVTYGAYALNLSHAPLGDKRRLDDTPEMTRYTNFPFERIVRYKNSYFGMAAGALYLLEGTTDNGTAIPYAVRTAITDFDTPNLKTVESVYLGGRVGPGAVIDWQVGETGDQTYTYTTPRGQGAQNHRQPLGRGIRARYYAMKVSGSDAFELDQIEFNIAKLARRI